MAEDEGGGDAAQQIVDTFVAGMVEGRRMPMVQASGTSTCLLKLDQEVTTLSVIAGKASREVSLSEIAQIMMGEDSPDGVQLPLDELCVTLALVDDHVFALRFDDMESRDTFALCLGMFVDQLHQGEYAEEEWQEDGAEGSSWPEPSGASGVHTYEAADFWKPSWCDLCQIFLSGWAKQGQACSTCRQVVCHECAKRGDPCRGSAGAVAEAGPPPRSPAAAPGADALGGSQQADSAAPPAANSTGGSKSSKSSDPRGGAAESELSESQRIVKKFVQRMVRGRVLPMLSKVGGSVECLVHLDRELKNIMIQRAGKKDSKQRAIPLTTVQEICVGREVADEVELPVDECSVTLMLEGGQAIAFRLEDEKDRDTFVLCMGTFVKGNRKESKPKRRHEKKK